MTTIRRAAAQACAVSIAAAAVAGCATGPAFQAPLPAPADQAQVYVYRPFVLAASGMSHKITVDAKAETLSLPNASWQRVLLPPGPHVVSIQDYIGAMRCVPFPLRLEVAAGQTYYVANVVKTTQGVGTLWVGCTVESRPQAQALKEMSGLSGAQ